jgi:hypothetical protein
MAAPRLRALGVMEKRRAELTPERLKVSRKYLKMGVPEHNAVKEIACVAGGLGFHKLSLVMAMSGRLLLNQLHSHGALPRVWSALIVKATPTPRTIANCILAQQPVELLKLTKKFVHSGRVSMTSDVAHKRKGAMAILMHFYDVARNSPDFVVVDSIQVEGENGEKNGLLLWRTFERFTNIVDGLPVETRVKLFGDATREIVLGGVASDGTALVASIDGGQAGDL